MRARAAEVVELADRRRKDEATGGLPLGLELDEDLTLEQWLEVGAQVKAQHNRSRFMLGDWLIFGERFGEEAAQSDYSDHTLQTYKRVASRIEIGRRRGLPLTFGHHQVVAPYEAAEQDELLDLALEHRWNRDELRAEVDRRHPGGVRGDRKRQEHAEQPGLEIEPAAGEAVVEPSPPIVEPENGSASDAEPAPRELTRELDPPEPSWESPQATSRHQAMSPDDAAWYLETLIGTSIPENMRQALSVVLDERKKLRAVLDEARRVIGAGDGSPGLTAAVSELEW